MSTFRPNLLDCFTPLGVGLMAAFMPVHWMRLACIALLALYCTALVSMRRLEQKLGSTKKGSADQ